MTENPVIASFKEEIKQNRTKYSPITKECEKYYKYHPANTSTDKKNFVCLDGITFRFLTKRLN